MGAAALKGEPRVVRIYYWAPAPNRHLDPLLDALRAAGALEQEVYGATKLAWQRLGSASPVQREGRHVLPSLHAGEISRFLAGCDPAGVHLVHGLRELSAAALPVLREQHRTVFSIVEAPQPRRSLDPIRIARDAVYARRLKAVSGLLAVSRFAAAAAMKLGVPRDRIVPVGYGLAPARFLRQARLPGRILYCGRAMRRKGIEMLGIALELLHDGGVDFTFDFVGDGPLAASFVTGLEAKGIRVRRHGSVPSDRVLELMAEASVVVMPSLFAEGWGYVVNEAVATGTVVVASDIVGASELIVPGVNGFVFRAGDVSALTEALRSAIHLARSLSFTGDESLWQIADAISPSALADHVLAALHAFLNDGPLPIPPLHQVVRNLGGNVETDWWRCWRAGGGLPAAPAISVRELRRL
jgi:glycosyltransferase involved in cell wall biosynthesis